MTPASLRILFRKPLPAFLLLLILAGQGTFLAWNTGQTTDEPYAMAMGWPILHHADYRFLGEHPPLVFTLGALPLTLVPLTYPYQSPVQGPEGTLDLHRTGDRFLYEMGNSPRLLLFASRMAVVGLTIFLGAVLYAWARKLYGEAGAWVSLALYVFCPNILAHGSLYTTDLGITAMFFATFYFLDCFFRDPRPSKILLAGTFAGLSLLAKINAMLLLPLVVFLFFEAALFKEAGFTGEAANSPKQLRAGTAAACLLLGSLFSHSTPAILWGPVFLLAIFDGGLASWPAQGRPKKIAWVVLQIAGWGTLIGLAAVHRKHGVLYQGGLLAWLLLVASAAAALAFQKDRARWSPAMLALGGFWAAALAVVILGYFDYARLLRGRFFVHFLKNFHMVFSHTQGVHLSCVGGSFIPCDERYYLASLLVKTPVAALGLGLLGFFGMIFSRTRSVLTRSLVLVPPLAYLIVASYFNHIRIGLRHILPVYPFIFLMAGGVPAWVQTLRPGLARGLGWAGLLLLVGFSTFSTLRFFPDYLPYFNEFVGSAEAGAALTDDSNLNWGQDHRRLARLVRDLKIGEVAVCLSRKNDAEFRYYGMKWRLMREAEFIHPSPGWYALDVGMAMQLKKFQPSWFYRRTPDAKAGKTIYLFQVP